MTLDSTPVRAGFRGGHVCHAYNEAAFRHFLAIERARAERSKRFLYLALVAILQSPGRRRAQLSVSTSSALLLGLGTSVREVDFVGWYREGQVAAAVLAQGPKAFDAKAAPVISGRIAAELKKHLSAADSNNLSVRVVRLGGRSGL
jgi:hypothetical protein